jgi:hypothetical protein
MRAAGHVLDVAAGAEMPAGAAQHDGTRHAVAFGRASAWRSSSTIAMRHRVAHLGRLRG